jgi:uncharacterized protein YndB with AHSA1/START domain
MTETTNTNATPDDFMTISRYFAATPAEVYQAFVDPTQLAQWFGPLTFHVPTGSIDVDARSGGHYKMNMVSNDDPSVVSPINSTFEEVIENELLLGYEIVQGFPGMEDGAKLTMRIEFHAEGEGTRLELRQGPFPELMSEMSSVGWNQSFAKLDGLFATPAKWRTSEAMA